jgi:hypothetical protein
MLNVDQQTMDYDGYQDYKQRSEYLYGDEQGTPASQSHLEYGKSVHPDFSRDDLASDYGRLANDYQREQEVAGKQYSAANGQNSAAGRHQSRDSAVRQSPFAADRTGSAYSSVSK